MDAINEDLKRWFRERWVDISRKDKSGKHPPCGRSKASKKNYPKCRPSVRVSSETPETSGEMSGEEKKKAVRQKRHAEATEKRKGKKPIMRSHHDIKEEYLEEKNAPTNKKLYARVKALAKRKFKVYPSAYANAWLVKEYKKRGGGYRSVSEDRSHEIKNCVLMVLKEQEMSTGQRMNRFIDRTFDAGAGAIKALSAPYRFARRTAIGTAAGGLLGLGVGGYHGLQKEVPTTPFTVTVSQSAPPKDESLWQGMKRKTKEITGVGAIQDTAETIGNEAARRLTAIDQTLSSTAHGAASGAMLGFGVGGALGAIGSRRIRRAAQQGTKDVAGAALKGYQAIKKATTPPESSTPPMKEEINYNITEAASKKDMPCNKPRPSTSAGKKMMVKACEGGKEKIVHFGAKGYGHNYSAAARKSFKARHKCSEKKSKLSAQYWACKKLWAGKGGSKASCPPGRKCKY